VDSKRGFYRDGQMIGHVGSTAGIAAALLFRARADRRGRGRRISARTKSNRGAWAAPRLLFGKL